MIRTALPLLCLAFVSSCTVHPFIIPRESGKPIASLGGSLMTKSKDEGASLELADGTKISYFKNGSDETVIPGKYIDYKTIVGLAGAANDGEAIREQGETARTVSGNSVKKAEIDGDVAVKTFVPPETVAP